MSAGSRACKYGYGHGGTCTGTNVGCIGTSASARAHAYTHGHASMFTGTSVWLRARKYAHGQSSICMCTHLQSRARVRKNMCPVVRVAHEHAHRTLVRTRACKPVHVRLFRNVGMHVRVCTQSRVHHYWVVFVSAQARRGRILQTEPFACTLLLTMDMDDDWGFEERLEQEAHERAFFAKEAEEQALREHAVFDDDACALAEPCASNSSSSPARPSKGSSPASTFQSPSLASTPGSAFSGSSGKRMAEPSACREHRPPRKRLRGKQSVLQLPVREHDSVPLPVATFTPFWADFSGIDPHSLDSSIRYNKCYYKLRAWLFSNRFAFTKAGKHNRTLVTMLVKAVTGWRQLPKWGKRLVISHFLSETQAPDVVRTLFHLTWPESDRMSDESAEGVYRKHGKSLLLTFIGEWGLLSSVEGLDADDIQKLPWREVAHRVRNSSACKQLWAEFCAMCEKSARALVHICWASCFEICMSTLIKERKIRVHGHFYLRREQGRIDLRGLDSFFDFRGVSPRFSEYLRAHSRSCSASWQGAFYCQAPKIGALFSAGDIEPFTKYPVNADWIFTLVQQEKIEYDDAKEWIVRCGRGVGRRLQDLSAWQTARAEIEARVYVAEAQAVHAAANFAWRHVPVIEQWKTQNTQPMMRRKKFLVLAGPTGVGKTEYVKGLFGPEHTLELNAAGMEHPCLREFCSAKHQCILWDEAEATLIAQNRKLFQCPACFIELGFSPTGFLTYKVMVNKAVMVVNSNRWEAQLGGLAKGDRDWIVGNSVVVDVDEPLWIAPPTSCEADAACAAAAAPCAAASSVFLASSCQSPAPEGAATRSSST